MGISFRFYEKKRGTRRTGSHRAGSIGELAFSCAMFVLGIIGTIGLWCSLLLPEWEVNFGFAQGACRVTAKQIESKSVDGKELYRPLVTLEYQIGHQIYQTTTYDIRGNWYEEKVEAANRIVSIRIGKDYRFWYDREDPRRAVLVQGITIWFWLALAIPFSLVFLGAARSVYILYTWRISAERRANIENWRAAKRLPDSEPMQHGGIHGPLTEMESSPNAAVSTSTLSRQLSTTNRPVDHGELTPENTLGIDSAEGVERVPDGMDSYAGAVSHERDAISKSLAEQASEWKRKESSPRSQSRRLSKDGIPGVSTECFPWDKNLIHSPGKVLAYRLPTIRGMERTVTVLLALSAVWNLVSVGMLVTVISSWITSQTPGWGTFLGLSIFLLVGMGWIGYTWRLYRRLPSRSLTVVEISEYPLHPGKPCEVYVQQRGQHTLRTLDIWLVCEESAVFGHGTNTRRETARVYQESVFAVQSVTPSSDTPVEIRCQIGIPMGAMHSFQSEHNRVIWKLVVQVSPKDHETFERSFPLLVIPDLTRTSI
ncbi:MAG: DUF3592 domain-containing protein [Thermoguttaceae bacterium]|nr:DUF3592 domain-containing protein [Thermoguttaceae bacterium]